MPTSQAPLQPQQLPPPTNFQQQPQVPPASGLFVPPQSPLAAAPPAPVTSSTIPNIYPGYVYSNHQ